MRSWLAVCVLVASSCSSAVWADSNADDFSKLISSGETASLRGEFPKGAQYFFAAIKLAGKNNHRLAECYEKLGELYQRAGRKQDGLRCFEQAVIYADKGQGASLILLTRLGELSFELHQYDKAEHAFQRSSKLTDKININAKECPQTYVLIGITTPLSLADTYTEERKYEQAEPIYLKAIKLLEDKYGRNDMVLGMALRGYYRFLVKTGRTSEADAVKIRGEHLTGNATGEFVTATPKPAK